MMIKFVATVGHRFCSVNLEDETRRLFVKPEGEGWTGDVDLVSR